MRDASEEILTTNKYTHITVTDQVHVSTKH